MKRFSLILCVCLLAGCQRAQQYPPLVPPAEKVEEQKATESERVLRELSWAEPTAVRQTPIVFVPATHPEWAGLARYWNQPPSFAGLPTIHIGFGPFEIAASWALVEKQQVVKIKVPRGLPDPTPHVPSANPPSVEKWRLGKTLFFQPIVKTDKRTYSCATCHDPRHGFTEDPSNRARAKYNTPSLINVVYNRRQFWDGRVETLEETLFRGPDDERLATPEKRLERGLEQHVWGGWVRELAQTKNKDLEPLFVQAFGTDRPTQANVAQALATYLRTILSGDSLYDHADKALEAKDLAMSAALFEHLLKDEATAQTLRNNTTTDLPKRDELATLWASGRELFHGRAGCVQCHRGALFTDGDFHNTGCDEKENWPYGRDSGRAAHLVGALKDPRLMGAFRTPSLRNLRSRHAYFHDGSRHDLSSVIEFYDHEVLGKIPYVAKVLKDGNHARFLHLTVREAAGLVVFLRSLQGQPVDAVISAP